MNDISVHWVKSMFSCSNSEKASIRSRDSLGIGELDQWIREEEMMEFECLSLDPNSKLYWGRWRTPEGAFADLYFLCFFPLSTFCDFFFFGEGDVTV